jgi:ribosome-associated protein
VTLDNGVPSDRLRVNAALSIPLSELRMRASRAGGPGGQHVNTSSTRIEVEWEIPASRALTSADRERLLSKLASRVDSTGTLRIVSAETRSQAQNRERALERLAEVVRAALIVPKTRKKTKPSKGAKEQRLDAKKRRSAAKRDRRWSGDE